MRVLLADDHSIVRRGLRGLLEAAGLQVVGEAGDGLEAVRLCEAHQPDILILDIGMPRLNGIEVAARAQKLARPPGVIVLSVHADESYIIRALAAGARAYLLKSATDEDLIPAVRAVAAGKP
jgi:two-component system response regulator NreC